VIVGVEIELLCGFGRGTLARMVAVGNKNQRNNLCYLGGEFTERVEACTMLHEGTRTC